MYLNNSVMLNMSATIELHGGKLIARDENDMTHKVRGTHLIPGDRIRIEDESLIERIEQPGIATVISCEHHKAILHVSTVPLCGFSPVVYGQFYAGDRVIIWLYKDGSISAHGRYSSLPTDDVTCILHAYTLFKEKRPSLTYNTGNALYTKPYQDETSLQTFTIDPEHSVDFDDAISIDVANRTIYVHIVHLDGMTVSEEERMRQRCFTLYLANEHTEHLLDTETAAHRLSLIKGEARRVITVKTVLDTDGMVTSYDIYPSTICVKKRYHYEEVMCLLQEKDDAEIADLLWLRQLTRQRSEHIKYTIQLPSVKFYIQEGLIQECYTELMDDSHSMVATAMILTNMIVSRHLREKGMSIPNRFHERLRGLSCVETPSGNIYVDSFITVKKFARACYDLDRRGHFGLGITDYVHFTSPMRRYADVLVHRMLAGVTYKDDELETEVQWINHQSHIVKTLQNVYTTWKIGRYIRTLPNEHRVWITSVKKSGVMWYMPSLSLNGYTHVSGLRPKQFWKWVPEDEMLQNGDMAFRVGQECIGKIVSMDTVTYVIQMEIS